MRRCYILDLKNDPELIAGYQAWHAAGAVPSAVVGFLRASGIGNMEIHRSGDRLVMIVEGEGAVLPAEPAVQEWERLMDTFQQPVPWARAGEKWTLAERIFDLAEQP